MAMAVLSSGSSSTVNQILVQEVLLSALLTKGSIREIKPDKTFSKPNKISIPDSQRKYEGIYGNSLSGIYQIAMSEEGILTKKNLITTEEETEQKYIYAGDGKFYTEEGSTCLSFVEEKNGNTYIHTTQYLTLPQIGQCAVYQYELQKLAAHPISDTIKAAWEKRAGKTYFLVNEKYSSVYFYQMGKADIVLLKELEGYCQNTVIEDKDNARQLYQIPGVQGRDLGDYHFYRRNQMEYLKVGEGIFVSEDAVKILPEISDFACKIGAQGFAQWYQIDKKTGNKKMKVTLPKKASFTVYDEKGICTYNSMISNSAPVTLPANGYIVFAGDANAIFNVTYVK